MPPTKFQQDIHRLNKLAFADRDWITALLRFRDQTLSKAAKGPERKRTAALFEQLLEMALQGNSVHPSDPLQLADAAKVRLCRRKKSSKVLEVLERLLVGDDLTPRSGNNALRFAKPAMVVAHEHQRKTGGFKVAYKAPIKYVSYGKQVRASKEFRTDWALVKRHFKVAGFLDTNGIVRRSPNPEYNWRKPQPLRLDQEATAFQVVFDFFCWKWFLWGMRYDKPLVEQLFYAITPYGTQIFIPGYWSLDAARDIHWDAIKRLHAARGIHRQGEKLVHNRELQHRQRRTLASANAEAQQRGIRGAARYALLKKAAGLVPETDDAQVRRLLRAARLNRD